MDHPPSCKILQSLCISITRSHDVINQMSDKIRLVDQLLDVILASGGTETVQEGSSRSGILDVSDSVDTGAVCIGEVALEGSRLYADRALYKSVQDQDTDGPGRPNIVFTSEALYCKALLDMTSPDERLLANPKRVSQTSDEIDIIQRQTWQCLDFDRHCSTKILAGKDTCAYPRDDVMCMVKALCDGLLLGGHWQCILQEIHAVTIQKETPEQQSMFDLGLKLRSALTYIKACWYPRTTSKTKQKEEVMEVVLHNVDQILSQIPESMTKRGLLNRNIVEKYDFGVCIEKLCRFLDSVADGKLQDLCLPVAMVMSQDKEKADNCLVGWIRRVDERLLGYEGCLNKMLTQYESFVEKEEWIVCLEKNSTTLAIPSICKQLCDVIMTMSACKQRHSPVFNRLLKVFLSSFASLPPLSQNYICHDIWSQPSGYSLFSSYYQEDFYQHMTTAFNRVVNVGTADALEEIIGEISPIAMQSPSDTLHVAVNRAMSNSAATQSIIKVLQLLPFLASFKQQGDNTPLLVEILRNVIETCNDMSNTEETNLIHLISQLMKPYKLELKCPYQEKPLLSRTQLMESCILPYLHCGIMGNGSYDNQRRADRLGLCVKLLDVTLKSLAFADHSSPSEASLIPEISLFPIILCVCDLLDQSYALWDISSPSCLTPDMKEIVTGSLLRLSDLLRVTEIQDEDFYRSLQWLLNQVSGLHWTVQLQLGICIQHWMPDYKKVVPACLFDLCDLSPEHWTGIPNRNESDPYTLSDQLMTWMQCCRISNQISTQLCKALKRNEEWSQLDFLQATLVAMTTVFPQSCMGEMERITSALKQLIKEGTLHVPISSQFMTCLPMFSYSEHIVALCMCQLFTSSVSLLTSSYCEDWVSVPMWAHVIRGVVICFKNMTSDITACTTDNPAAAIPGSIFALSQVFCHTCHMITLIPHEIGEQLFVLALDIMGMMQDYVSAAATANKEREQCVVVTNEIRDKFEWTNEGRAMKMVIDELNDEEQRKTLMQKLCSLNQNVNRTIIVAQEQKESPYKSDQYYFFWPFLT